PEAVMRFRQGVGRLIRRATDRGVLVVCDPRLARASYRGAFRAALPVEPRLQKDALGLAREAGAVLARGDGVATEGGPRSGWAGAGCRGASWWTGRGATGA